MKKIVCLCVMSFVFLLCSNYVYALDDNDKKIEFSLTQSFASRHICEAQDSFPEDDPIWETSLDNWLG